MIEQRNETDAAVLRERQIIVDWMRWYAQVHITGGRTHEGLKLFADAIDRCQHLAWDQDGRRAR